MKKVYYNKLIRDKIPEKIEKNGSQYKIRKLSEKDFEKELLKKVEEEASGLIAAKTRQELISELADIIAVIEEVKKLKWITLKQISKALAENNRLKGGFKKKLFLIWSSDDKYKTNEKLKEKPRK